MPSIVNRPNRVGIIAYKIVQATKLPLLSDNTDWPDELGHNLDGDERAKVDLSAAGKRVLMADSNYGEASQRTRAGIG